jgi:uncharacterized cupredoxin-like copper-binding protein
MARLLVAASASLLLISAVACTGGPGASAPRTSVPSATRTAAAATVSPAATSGKTKVDVTLQEWAVAPSESSAPAGDITFAVTNNGPEDKHEFVVIKTNLAPNALPTDRNGAVDEEGEGIEVIGEIEEIAPGDSDDLKVDLEAGSYVLLCNIWDDEENEAHYEQGMRIGFDVTD